MNDTKHIFLSEKQNNIKNGLYYYTQIVFAYNSNHIEGSKLSQEQTRYIYETNSFISDKDEIVRVNDVLEAKNHFKAFDFILENNTNILDEKYIKELHKILKQGISDEVIGEYKKRVNFIGDTTTTKPILVKFKMNELFLSYNDKKDISVKDIIDFHVKFEQIHPFEDGNGRVGRLIMFKECLKHNITPFIIDDEHKLFYYRGLKEYDKTKGYLIDTCLSCQDRYKELLNTYCINKQQDTGFKR